MKPTLAEVYANEKSGEWLYDKDGYCPFARHKLEFLLRLAHEAGAASIKKASSLTPIQQEAIVSVIENYISNDEYDIARMFGLTIQDARDRIRILKRVTDKLSGGKDEAKK